MSTPKLKVKADPARLAETRERLKALLDGRRTDRIPLAFRVDDPKPLNCRDAAMDDLKSLEHQVEQMNRQFEAMPEADVLPMLNTQEFGQAFVPSLFGVEVAVDEIQPPYSHGRVIRDLREDLARLPKRVDLEKDGWGPRLRERMRLFLEATDYAVPIGVVDYQSPYGVATKLIDNEALMIAMYDTPELVHELMGRATQAIIDSVRTMQRWAGDPALIATNPDFRFPEGGCIVWDDYVSVISPDLHTTFCLPYNERLYAEFGRGHFHTCGPYFPNYLDPVLRHKGLRSIDISWMLRGLGRTREDMLLLKERARAAGVVLQGPLVAKQTSMDWAEKPVDPDEDFLRRMAAGGGLLWSEGGSRDVGLKYLEMAGRCAS